MPQPEPGTSYLLREDRSHYDDYLLMMILIRSGNCTFKCLLTHRPMPRSPCGWLGLCFMLVHILSRTRPLPSIHRFRYAVHWRRSRNALANTADSPHGLEIGKYREETLREHRQQPVHNPGRHCIKHLGEVMW